jgi:hypothetical protein
MTKNMQPIEVQTHLVECLQGGDLKPDDFSIRTLFEETVPNGNEIVESFNPTSGGVVALMEAGVDSSVFKNISGQIVYSAMLETYNMDVFIGNRLARTIPTKFDGEKIPGITQIGDQAQTVLEGREYPVAGVSGTFNETPQTTKKGLIVEITKEAVFFDRTGMVLDQCRKVGEWLGVNKEKRIIDMALGVTSTWNPEGKGALSTYSNSTGLHDFDNLANSNSLADWTDIVAAQTLLDAITDPFTGEPIVLNATAILIPKSLAPTARYVLNNTQVKIDPNANAGTAQYVQYVSTPTLLGGQTFEVLTNQWVAARMSAGSVNTSNWYYGDFQKAFAYMENWPLTVVQDDGGNRNFTADVVARFKASERGVAAVLDPRYVVLSAPA